MYGWQVLQQPRLASKFLAPNLPLIMLITFNKFFGLSEHQLFGHQSGVSMVVLQLSDGVLLCAVPATLWVIVGVQDGNEQVQCLVQKPL